MQQTYDNNSDSNVRQSTLEVTKVSPQLLVPYSALT